MSDRDDGPNEHDLEEALHEAEATAQAERERAGEMREAVDRLTAELAEIRRNHEASGRDADIATAAAAEQRTRADRLNDERINRKVDDLVGWKIRTFGRDAWLKLARTDEATFDELAATLVEYRTPVNYIVATGTVEDSALLDEEGKWQRFREMARARAKETGQKVHEAMSEIMRERPGLVPC